MRAYLLRKLVGLVTTVFGVSALLFAILHGIGGDPALQMLGAHAMPSQLAELRTQCGFDRPLVAQFADYLWQIMTFDFGDSYAYRRPIRSMIIEGIGPSLSLALPAFLVATFAGISAGLFAARYRGRISDRALTVFCALGGSLPMLAYILVLQYFLAFRLGWFPISGYETEWPARMGFLGLPIFIWVAVSLGHDVRYYRAAFLQESGRDYVWTARAKGLSERRIYLTHVLRNGIAPAATHAVMQIPLLVLGSYLLESFFGIPGLGRMTIEAFHNGDFPMVRAMATFQSALYILGNFGTGLAYAWADPRVRLR